MRTALEDDGHCFACGRKNRSGLRLTFTNRHGKTLADFTPQKRHQGFKNLVHGGIITAVLDEAMMKSVLARGISAVTAELEVRFRSPLFVGEKASIEAEITTLGPRLIEASAMMKTGDSVIATAKSKIMRNG